MLTEQIIEQKFIKVNTETTSGEKNKNEMFLGKLINDIQMLTSAFPYMFS